jgi:sugar phosphate isomerase/epimerase
MMKAESTKAGTMMQKAKLCMGLSLSIGCSAEEQVRLFQACGFDGFFMAWREDLAPFRALADEIHMYFQSIHAPFSHAADMWRDDALAEAATEELIRCVRDTAAIHVPILVIHPYKGFDGARATHAGVANFGKVVAAAKECGVQIAFENVEGEEQLAALMDAFQSEAHVGFCWDSGHELCYNRGKDMLALYGDRLIATHLNDNLGVSREDGTIFWTDDLHLLPFDGIHDWDKVADRLIATGFDGPLTFELNRLSKPNRHENDMYLPLTPEEYVSACYTRAARFAAILASKK